MMQQLSQPQTQQQEKENTPEPNQDPLDQFLVTITKELPAPILKKPRRKIKSTTVEVGEENQVRRSGRIAEKVKAKGLRSTEEMAQQLVAKKMGALSPETQMTKQAKERYEKMYGKPLSSQVMAAMEGLIKAIGNGKAKSGKAKCVLPILAA
uniref:Uncharacterized protein n=1 Tax=Arundo donax TaxID=35708 RepID=A0A0A8XWI5_ARUDO